MLSATHKMTEQLVAATAPIFRSNPNYETILQSACLWFARIIQSTPDKGEEFKILDQAHEDIAHALEQFLKLEEQASIEKASERDRLVSKLEQGIEGFGNLSVVNGNEPGPALVGETVIVEKEIDFTDDQIKTVITKLLDAYCQPGLEEENDVASAIEESLGEEAEEDRS